MIVIANFTLIKKEDGNLQINRKLPKYTFAQDDCTFEQIVFLGIYLFVNCLLYIFLCFCGNTSTNFVTYKNCFKNNVTFVANVINYYTFMFIVTFSQKVHLYV